MNIYHGKIEIAGQMGILCGELKQRGHHAVAYNSFHSYLGYEEHLINTSDEEIAERHGELIDEFELFHFHYASSMLDGYEDLPLIAAQGKKMIMHHWGNDVRFHDQARVNNPYVYTGDSPPNEVIHERLSKISRYIKVAIVQDREVAAYVEPYYEQVHIVPIAIDLSKFAVGMAGQEGVKDGGGDRTAEDYGGKVGDRSDGAKGGEGGEDGEDGEDREDREDRQRLLILHAPTNPEFKGTKPIEAALEALAGKYDFEYRRIEKMNHEEAIKLYRHADLIVDQILCGSYGLLSVETMALGKPVITYIRDDLQATFPPELPIVSANPDTVEERIASLLEDAKLRRELGRRGRVYVEKYHAKEVVADQLERIYESL